MWPAGFESGTMNIEVRVPDSVDPLLCGFTSMMSLVWPFLIYWLVMFVACFVVVEIGQDQLYDEVTPRVGLKVAGGSALIAMVIAGAPVLWFTGIV